MFTINNFLSTTLISVSVIFSCNSKKKDVLYLPEGLSIVNTVNDRNMADELSKSTKVVAFFYSEHVRKIDLPRYNKFIKEYPELGFIFYVDHNDKISLKEFMKENRILSPVYFDPEQKFIEANKNRFRKNWTFIGYIVNAKNEIIRMTNPSLPDFEQVIKNEINK